jgi:hypothetical protein
MKPVPGDMTTKQGGDNLNNVTTAQDEKQSMVGGRVEVITPTQRMLAITGLLVDRYLEDNDKPYRCSIDNNYSVLWFETMMDECALECCGTRLVKAADVWCSNQCANDYAEARLRMVELYRRLAGNGGFEIANIKRLTMGGLAALALAAEGGKQQYFKQLLNADRVKCTDVPRTITVPQPKITIADPLVCTTGVVSYVPQSNSALVSYIPITTNFAENTQFDKIKVTITAYTIQGVTGDAGDWRFSVWVRDTMTMPGSANWALPTLEDLQDSYFSKTLTLTTYNNSTAPSGSHGFCHSWEQKLTKNWRFIDSGSTLYVGVQSQSALVIHQRSWH